MTTTPASGQVHKVVRIVASSPESWEHAARAAVAEASKTISDLHSASVVKTDTLVRDGRLADYRIKLELAFQIDRSRSEGPDEIAVQVRRYLVVANQTLASPGLYGLIAEKVASGPSEFHVLVPATATRTIYHDPTAVLDQHLAEVAIEDRRVAQAEGRLAAFREVFAHLGPKLTGEVGIGDPVAAARRVMERSTFDEIIVSTLPPGMSRWLRLDLATRLERALKLPVTSLVQEPADH